MFESFDTRTRLISSQFLLGMMFFYGIEQLFIDQNFGSAARGAITIAFIVGILIFNIPTGILADTFGRKRCLLWGCLAGFMAVILLALSHSLTMYLLGCLLFGLFISFHNGTAEALLYDWLASQGRTKLYAKYQGSMYAAYLLGAGVANLLSGFIAESTNLRFPYFLSVIPIVIAGTILIGLQEPPLVRGKKTTWYAPISEVVMLIQSKPRLLAFGLQLVVAEILFLTVAEFGQVYMLSFGISTITLGIFWAIDAAFAAAGRGFAHRVQSKPRQLVLTFCVVLSVFSFIDHKIGIGIFWVLWGMTEMLANVAGTEVQHETPSNIRATVISTISFVANLIGIPVLVAYTLYYKSSGIFAANRAVILGCVVVLLLTLLVRPSKGLRSFEDTLELPPSLTI